MEPRVKNIQPLGNGVFAAVSERHTFGTDAVLLSYFAAAKDKDRLVDLGTGCGIIPLLMLRDGRLSSATGVEISAEAAALARENAVRFKEKFSVYEGDMCALPTDIFPAGGYTLVTCNPPYKAPGAGIVNPDPICAAARHELACTLESIVKTAARLLRPGGRFCICQRPERAAELICLMSKMRVEPKRMRIVCKKTGCEPWLILLEGKKDAKPGLRISPPLFVYENGELSGEMHRIYGVYKEGHG